MTQYLMAVYSVEGEEVPDPAQIERAYADVDAFNRKLQDKGAWVFAGGLEPVDGATVIRKKSGRLIATDGPFAESKEVLGGFWVIEAPDRSSAFRWAEEASVACKAPVEVRAFQDE